MSGCNICLQELKVEKCKECTFNSCEECMMKWYSIRACCPQCKKMNTFKNFIKFENSVIFLTSKICYRCHIIRTTMQDD